jgi:hypothetical protein
MADSRALATPQLLQLLRELRKVEGAEVADPEPIEVGEAHEVWEREHSSPQVLGG